MGFAIALVLLACFPAQAATVTQSHFPPNPGLMPGGGWTWAANSNWADPPPPRQWTNGVYGGVKGVTAVDAWSLSGRAGNLAVQRPIFSPLTAVGAALARCLGNFICATVGTTAALSIPAALDRLRVKKDPVSGDVRYDPGVPPVTEPQTMYRFQTDQGYGYVNDWRSSPQAVSQGYVDAYNATQGWPRMATNGVCTQLNASVMSCGMSVRSGPGDLWPPYEGGPLIVWSTQNVQSCPPSTDPLDPQYNVPSGSPVGPDGKCPTARYNWAPITPEGVGEKLNEFDPSSPTDVQKLLDALRDALARGEQIPGSESLPMSGPASQTGTPATSTTNLPGGGTRTETRTPTYSYTYGDTNITYNTTYTTVINDNGEVTTIEEGGGSGQEQSDFCVQNPNVLACLQLGDPPSAPQPLSEQVITYEVDALGLPAGCPAPMEATFPVVGLVSVAWTPICDLAPLVRAMLLAMSAFGAALVIVMNVRQAT